MGQNKQTSYFKAGGAMKIFIFLLLLSSSTSAAAGDKFKGKVSLDEKANAEGTNQGEESRKDSPASFSPAKADKREEIEKGIVQKHSEMFVGVNFVSPDGNSPGTHHTVDAVDYCKQNKWCNQRLYQP